MEALGQKGLEEVLWLLAPLSGYGLDPSSSLSHPPCLLHSGLCVYSLCPHPASLPGCLSFYARSHFLFPCLFFSFLAPFSLSFLYWGSGLAMSSPALLAPLPPPLLLDASPGFSLPSQSQTLGRTHCLPDKVLSLLPDLLALCTPLSSRHPPPRPSPRASTHSRHISPAGSSFLWVFALVPFTWKAMCLPNSLPDWERPHSLAFHSSALSEGRCPPSTEHQMRDLVRVKGGRSRENASQEESLTDPRGGQLRRNSRITELGWGFQNHKPRPFT